MVRRLVPWLALLLSGCCCVPDSLLEVFDDEPEVLTSSADQEVAYAARRAPGEHLTTAGLTQFALGSAVPQPRNLARFYADASAPTAGGVDYGVLVCQVLVTGSGYDNGPLAGGADVMMRLSADGRAERRTSQSSTRLYAFPVRSLQDGAPIGVVVLDDDVFADDLIGRGAGTYMSGQVNVHTEGAEVSCRLASGPSVDTPRRATLAALRESFTSFGALEPDLHAEHHGYPDRAAYQVERALVQALSWWTHDDPELLSALAPADDIETRWVAALDATIGQALRGDPAPGRAVGIGEGVRVSATPLLCGSEALDRIVALGDAIEPGPGCITTLAFRSQTPGTLAIGPGGLEIVGIGRAGELSTPHERARGDADSWTPRAEANTPVSFAQDERRRFVIGFAEGEPVLLRVRWRGAAVLLRVR